jgi:hypothetical protein
MTGLASTTAGPPTWHSWLRIGIAGVLVIVAIVLTLMAQQRWAVAAAHDRLVTAALAADAARLAAARRHAVAVASGDPGLLLAATDLREAADRERLARIGRGGDMRWRQAAATTLALAALAADAPAEAGLSVPEPDATWIAAARAPWSTGPTWPAGAPWPATQAVVLPRLLSAAWAAGDGPGSLPVLRQMLLLFPKHPERPAWLALLAVADRDLPPSSLRQRLASCGADWPAQRVGDTAAALLPGRLAALRAAGWTPVATAAAAAPSSLRLGAAIAQADGSVALPVADADGRPPTGTLTAVADGVALRIAAADGRIVLQPGGARRAEIRHDGAVIGTLALPETP